MNPRVFATAFPAAAICGLVLKLLFLQPGFTQDTARTGGAGDPGVRAGAASAGKPLEGLTAGELPYFTMRQEAFEEIGSSMTRRPTATRAWDRDSTPIPARTATPSRLPAEPARG